jgi:hypothetical protein
MILLIVCHVELTSASFTRPENLMETFIPHFKNKVGKNHDYF